MKTKRLRNIISLTLICLILVASLSGCGTVKDVKKDDASDTTKVYKIRLAEFYAPPPGGGGLTKAARWWADEVEKRTNGRVKIETGYSESFGKVSEMVDLLKNGAIEMASIAPGYYPTQMPLWFVTSGMPFITYNAKTTTDLMWKMYQTFPAMEAELKKNNMKILYISSHEPFKFLSTKKPIKSLADMKGMKIRSYGNLFPKMLEAVGAIPVNIPVNDAYDALQKGTLDATVGPMDMMIGSSWTDMGKYLTNVDVISPLSACGAINLDYWNKLPDDIQQIMIDVGQEHKAKLVEIRDQEIKEAYKLMESKGIKFFDLSAEEKAKWISQSPDFLNVWAKEMDAKGVPGTEFAKRYTEVMAELKAK